MPRILLLLTISFLFLSGSCSTGPRPTPLPEFPPVVLITIDTLRADHLSCYGYQGIRTARIDQLAADGILFEQAIAPAPITLPSHASILTGTYPLFHGVRDNTGFVLPGALPTLAETLSEQGYQTGAVVGAYVLHSSFGLDQGFDHYSEDFATGSSPGMSMEISERRAEAVIRNAEAWLSSQASDRFFLWMHLFDPHAPYAPPSPAPGVLPYDQEIVYVDGALGRFFDFLKKRGVYEESLIILTSDHGEGLGDHGEDTHGMFLYDSTLRVPLVFKLPGSHAAGTRVTTQVELVDLMPTILDLLGLPRSQTVQGRSIRPGWEGGELRDRAAYSEAMLPLLNYGWSDLSSLRTSAHKLIRAPQPELYALEQDPRETRNLYTAETELAEALLGRQQAMAEQLANEQAARALRAPDPETIERLRALGYVGSTAISSDSGSQDPIAELRSKLGGDPADPKSKIHLFNRVWQAQELVQAGQHEKALLVLDAILAEDSTIFLAHSLRSLSLLGLKRYREALVTLKNALDLRPEDPGAHIYRGIAAANLGELDLAASSLERGLALDPTNEAARNNLATVYLRQGKVSLAARMLESLAAEKPMDLAIRLNLGTLYLQEGRLAEAQETFQQVLEADPSIPEAHNNLALAYKSLGQLDQAERHLRTAIQLRPDYRNAYINLAEVLRSKGLESDARAAWEKAQSLR